MATFCLCSIKTFPKKMELSQNLWQTFACVASEKKHFLKKWSCHKIYGKLLLVASEKKTFLKKWSCHKIYGKCKIFLMAVFMIFKYSKRFRFAPSFNYGMKVYRYSTSMVLRLDKERHFYSLIGPGPRRQVILRNFSEHRSFMSRKLTKTSQQCLAMARLALIFIFQLPVTKFSKC